MSDSVLWQGCSSALISSVTVYPASLSKHPQKWTKEEVGEWLSWCTEEYAIEPIPPDKFDLNGKALCLLSRNDLIERVPKNGDVLFNCLRTLIVRHKGQHTYQMTHTNTPMPDNVAGTSMTLPDNVPGTSMTSPDNVIAYRDMVQGSVPQNDSVASGILIVPTCTSSLPGMAYPTTPRTRVPMSSLVPIRPRPYVAVQSSSTSRDIAIAARQKLSSECRLLWEFIYQLLSDKHYESYICWENKDEYVFRIINPSGLADLWGRQKNRQDMTYEKLSRALRYYYRVNIIKKVPGKRLTYRFLKEPSSIRKGQREAKPRHKLQMAYQNRLFGQALNKLSYCQTADSTIPQHAAIVNAHHFQETDDNFCAIDAEECNSKTSILPSPVLVPKLNVITSPTMTSRQLIMDTKTSISQGYMCYLQPDAINCQTLAQTNPLSGMMPNVLPIKRSHSDTLVFLSDIQRKNDFSDGFHPLLKSTKRMDTPRPNSKFVAASTSPSIQQEQTQLLKTRSKHGVGNNANIYQSFDSARSLHSFCPMEAQTSSLEIHVQTEPEDLSVGIRNRSSIVSPFQEEALKYEFVGSCSTITSDVAEGPCSILNNSSQNKDSYSET